MAAPSPSPRKPDGFVALAFPKAKPEPTASVHLSLVKSMSGQGGLWKTCNKSMSIMRFTQKNQASLRICPSNISGGKKNNDWCGSPESENTTELRPIWPYASQNGWIDRIHDLNEGFCGGVCICY